ncbi:MAG: hypothetical protein KatS3mg113_0875 [Planctomycetaceae bacterium]|nr:MAG: hypothetical protein KatS3mg113_0875 [Planctomycetaceae bacterium]
MKRYEDMLVKSYNDRLKPKEQLLFTGRGSFL